VRARDEPAEEPAEAEPRKLRDALVAAERRDLAEHAVAVRLRGTGEVLCEPPCLPERVLAGRRIDGAGRAGIRYRRAVAERPHGAFPLDLEGVRDQDAAPRVQ